MHACLSSKLNWHVPQALLSRCFPAIIMLWMALCCVPSNAEAKDGQKVLVLHSYHQGYLWTDMIQDGFSHALLAQFPKAEIFIEYMNTKRQSASTMSPHLLEIYKKLYQNVKFDVIVASDNNALDFLLIYRDSLFPGVPVVFCGINDFFKYRFDPASGYTGVREDLDIVSTIKVALQLHPGTKKVALITDDTESGLINLGLVRIVADQFPDIQWIELHNLTASQLSNRVKRLENDTVILALAFFRDPEGRTFSARESMEFILSASQRPVYTVWDFYMAPGAIGGKLLSGRLQGENAAALAIKVLQGEKVSSLPVISSPTTYIFDYKGLSSFNINASQLPEGSLVTGRPDTFYARYALYIWLGAALFAVQVIIISMMSWNIAHRKREEFARKNAETELRQSRNLLKDILEAASEVSIISTDKNGIITLANSGAERMLGYKAEELVGHCTPLILHQEAEVIARRRELTNELEKPVLDFEVFSVIPQSKGSETREWLYVRKNGSTFPVSLVVTIMRGTDNKISGYLGIAMDFSERKRAEEELRESERKWRAIFDGSPVGIVLMNQQAIVLECNQHIADIFGVEREKYIGLNMLQTLPDGIIRRSLIEAQNDNAIHHYEGPYTSVLSGKRLYIDITAERIAPDLIIVIMVDITEKMESALAQEKLQTQLHQAQKMESVALLAGGVAHDFNNMLGVILGHTELALNRLGPGNPLIPGLENIRKAAERSADLTRQLLAFARKQAITPKVIDLNKTIEGLLNMLRRLIGEDIDLVWLPFENLGTIIMDPSQVDQILVNLCVNARDAIGDTGKIIIETNNAVFDEDYCTAHTGSVPGEYVLLTVSDNGCGMDSETISHLFEPFFTTKEIGKGTGLGLSTVYGIVKQNSGYINVYSESDLGTTFKVYLPLSATKAELTEKTGVLKPATRGHETILLVEDEPLILNMTKDMLEHQGYTILTAATPDEAILLARKHTSKIHLLMTDVVMPAMNGRDLAKNLSSINPDLKLLFMSGYTADVIAHHGVLDEGVNFIQKPFTVKDLLAKTREVLNQNSY